MECCNSFAALANAKLRNNWCKNPFCKQTRSLAALTMPQPITPRPEMSGLTHWSYCLRTLCVCMYSVGATERTAAEAALLLLTNAPIFGRGLQTLRFDDDVMSEVITALSKCYYLVTQCVQCVSHLMHVLMINKRKTFFLLNDLRILPNACVKMTADKPLIKV